MLFFFTVFAIPLFWLAIAFIYNWSDESVYTSLIFCSGATLGMWLGSGIPSKVVALNAFVPSAFMLLIGSFSLLAMKCKNWFYKIVSWYLLRCVDNPILVICATVTLLSEIMAQIAKALHFTAFL
jgi:hypothetical protein